MSQSHKSDEFTYELMAKEITVAQSRLRSMSPEEVSSYYVNVLNALKNTVAGPTQPVVQLPLLHESKPTQSTKEQVTASLLANPDFITCLECGQELQMLTAPHLAKHNGLTPQTYKEKWGIDKKTKLACQSLLEQKRVAIDENKIWQHRKSAKKETSTPKGE